MNALSSIREKGKMLVTIKCNLKAFRKGIGLTQADLSKLSGVSRVRIAAYETGSCQMPIVNAIFLAHALKVNWWELYSVTVDVIENGDI